MIVKVYFLWAVGEVRVLGLVRVFTCCACSMAWRVIGGASIEAGKHALNLISHDVFFLVSDCYVSIIARCAGVVK